MTLCWITLFVEAKEAAALSSSSSPDARSHALRLDTPPLFAAKAGSVVEGGRVVFLDGYAGQGRYDDGTPGSPLLFVRAARANPQRAVTGIFVERDPQRFASLCQVLDRADPDGSVRRIVREGDLGALLPELLPTAAGGAALFAFLDPFGTALDVGQLRAGLLRRPGRAPTEVLLHFSVLTIARMGGILNASHSRGGGCRSRSARPSPARTRSSAATGGGLILDDGTHEFWRRPIAIKIPQHRPPPPGDTTAPAERAAGEEAG